MLTMKKTDLKKLKKEIDELGILNIEAFNDVDATCMSDAVQIVKDLDKQLNIDELLKINNDKIKAARHNAN